MSWAKEELGTAELGDQRLVKRLVKVAETLGSKPSESIPGACGGWADTRGAYRLFSNERCDWREMLEAHGRSSEERMRDQKVVLCINDTTELDFNGQTIDGLGPLSYEAQRGMYLHPTYAVSVDREPLGVLDAWMWAREPRGADGKRGRICESVRWVESYERLADRAAGLSGTRLVQVGDRESGILALMQRAQALGWPADLLVRVQHDRKLEADRRLFAQLAASPVLGEIEFRIGARKGRAARAVRQQIRVVRFELPAAEPAGAMFPMTCIEANEIGAPAGQKPLCWRLLTNREVTALAQASELIDWYRARWEIEMLFHVLKTGCRVEALQLASLERIERALVLFLIVAWRILRLMRLGRPCPDLPATLLFEPDEITAAYVLGKKPVPKNTPTLNEMVRRVAMLGGFLARKHDGEPGAKTLWIGMQRIHDFSEGLRHMRQSPSLGSCG